MNYGTKLNFSKRGGDIAGKILKMINLPIFMLFSIAVLWLIYYCGFIFVSQISNLFTITMIIALTIKEYKEKESPHNKFYDAAYAFVPLIAVMYVVIKRNATSTPALFYYVLVLVALTCSVIVFLLRVEKSPLKFILGILHGFVVGTIALFMFTMSFFAVLDAFSLAVRNIDEVSMAKLSPNGIYLLEVIRGSQGALGGHTSVSITKQDREINLLIGKIKPRPVIIHFGGWSEYYHIEGFSWDGDNTLFMFRSVYRGGHVYAFDLVNGRWVRSHVH